VLHRRRDGRWRLVEVKCSTSKVPSEPLHRTTRLLCVCKREG
jgi:hypothetical protein